MLIYIKRDVLPKIEEVSLSGPQEKRCELANGALARVREGDGKGVIAVRRLFALLRLSLSGHTDGLVETVSAAWRLASSRGHGYVTPQHLLVGLSSTKYGMAC
jgi:Clp amino terminal domain, pathogenicity island component